MVLLTAVNHGYISREASVCSLSCSNGISEGGKTFVKTCLNGEWVGDIDELECDGKIQLCRVMATITCSRIARI